MGLPTALSSERTDGHFFWWERAHARGRGRGKARTNRPPSSRAEKQIINFCPSPDLAMAQNTKNTERELKIQTTSKFFVEYKRREKKYVYIKQLLLWSRPSPWPRRLPPSRGAAVALQLRRRQQCAKPPNLPACTHIGELGRCTSGVVVRRVSGGGCVRGQLHAFLSSSKNGLIDPGAKSY